MDIFGDDGKDRYLLTNHAAMRFRERVRGDASWQDIRDDFQRKGTVEVSESWVRDVVAFRTIAALSTPVGSTQRYFLQADREGIWVIKRDSNGGPNDWVIVTINPIPYYNKARVLREHPLRSETPVVESDYEFFEVDDDRVVTTLSPNASKVWRPFRRTLSVEAIAGLPKEDVSADGKAWFVRLPGGERLRIVERTSVVTKFNVYAADDAVLPEPAVATPPGLNRDDST